MYQQVKLTINVFLCASNLRRVSETQSVNNYALSETLKHISFNIIMSTNAWYQTIHMLGKGKEKLNCMNVTS